MQGTAIKIISIVLIILLIGTAIGVIAYFTNGFTGEFKTFYVTVNGKDVLSSATGYMMSESEPLTVDVKYTFAERSFDEIRDARIYAEIYSNDGRVTRLIDYSSAGKTLDERSKCAVWIKK